MKLFSCSTDRNNIIIKIPLESLNVIGQQTEYKFEIVDKNKMKKYFVTNFLEQHFSDYDIFTRFESMVDSFLYGAIINKESWIKEIE